MYICNPKKQNKLERQINKINNLFKIFFLFVFLIILLTGFSLSKKIDIAKYKIDISSLCYQVPNLDEIDLLYPKKPLNYIYLGNSYIGFKEALGFKESRGDYAIVNIYGYLGKYQFGKNTLKLIGINDSDEFLNNSYLQEQAFTANTARNKWILRRDIKKFQGIHVGGVKITESGILAAAHLAGAGNVKKYLRSGGSVNFSDAFGTSIEYYLKKFSGYDTSFVVANRKAKA